ncbi:MAG: hypothetical protein ACM3PW_12490 [Chlamydiota bacterium]
MARTLYLLLALNLVLVGVCPLAPAMTPARVQGGGCRHEQLPASGQHSCCVTVHHQPALVRAAVENRHAIFGGGIVVQAASPAGRRLAAPVVVLAASLPSPPAFVLPILRI